MREVRRLALHIVLVVVAAGLALWKSQPEDPSDRKLAPGEVKMWGGTPKDVTKVVFEGTKRTVTLEQKSDDAGLWYEGSEEAAANPPPEETPDAGADPHGENPHEPKPEPVEPGKFVSVSVTEKVIEKLAPLVAERRIGEVTDDKLKEYGLDEPKGTLTVVVAGKTQELVIGAQTPSRGQTYVRWKADNLVYVIDASIARDLESGKGRLSERQQHSWNMSEAEKTVVTAGEHRYEVVRAGTAGRQFWAKPEAPDAPDETLQNWLKKAERLRPLKFVEALPPGAEKIFRVDFNDKKKAIGFLELYTHKAEGEKREWFVLTENLRMPSTVTASVADQVRDDLDSLFPGAGYSEQHKNEEPAKDEPAPKDPHGHGDAPDDDAPGDDAPEAPVPPPAVPPTGSADPKAPKTPEKAPTAPKTPEAPKAPAPKAP